MSHPWHQGPDLRRRARALGIPFEGEPGPLNAITDVAGVAVGYCTLISGDGPLVRGQGPIRTGVTAILPRRHDGVGVPVFAGVHSLNGNGEMTGFVWVEECGRTEFPIVITNTHSVGLARDAVLKWMISRHPERMPEWGLPVAAETYDGTLNDINGFHVHDAHVFEALDSAHGGPLLEGSVGGGTGMVCYEWKGGSGTASRKVSIGEGEIRTEGMVGAFVQANFGRRHQLKIAGLPVGRWLEKTSENTSKIDTSFSNDADQGSIIVIVGTDLPLLPHQLKRLARRAGLGIGRSGAIAGHGSGDIFLAFSTANRSFFETSGAGARELEALPDDILSPVFSAVIESVDEAILNALVCNKTMVGRDGHTVEALPHGQIETWCKSMTAFDQAPQSQTVEEVAVSRGR